MISTNQSGQTFPGLTLKAWALFLGNGTLIKGFNVASVSRSSAGVYVVTFTAATATATYAVGVKGAVITPTSSQVFPQTTASFTVTANAWAFGAATDQALYVEVWE